MESKSLSIRLSLPERLLTPWLPILHARFALPRLRRMCAHFPSAAPHRLRRAARGGALNAAAHGGGARGGGARRRQVRQRRMQIGPALERAAEVLALAQGALVFEGCREGGELAAQMDSDGLEALGRFAEAGARRAECLGEGSRADARLRELARERPLLQAAREEAARTHAGLAAAAAAAAQRVAPALAELDAVSGRVGAPPLPLAARQHPARSLVQCPHQLQGRRRRGRRVGARPYPGSRPSPLSFSDFRSTAARLRSVRILGCLRPECLDVSIPDCSNRRRGSDAARGVLVAAAGFHRRGQRTHGAETLYSRCSAVSTPDGSSDPTLVPCRS